MCLVSVGRRECCSGKKFPTYALRHWPQLSAAGSVTLSVTADRLSVSLSEDSGVCHKPGGELPKGKLTYT